MKAIILFQAEDVLATWMAAYMDAAGLPDKDVSRLFGTHIVPTPYFGGASYQMVEADVKRRNPDRLVKLS